MKRNVLQYLEQSAKNCPDKIALADEKTALTYSEYVTNAKIIGSYLVGKVTEGKVNRPIAVLIDRNVESVLAFMGCVYSGNFYVPIDVTMPAERIQLIFDTLQPIYILDATANGSKAIEGTKVSEILADGVVDEESLEKIRTNAIDTDPLYAIFTSGSTGVPKGVLISHRSVVDLVEAFGDVFGFDQEQVFGNQAPFDFDVSVKDLYNAMRCAATVQIIPKKLFMLPKMLVGYLNEKKINTLIWAVSALRIVSDFKTLDNAEAPNLKYVMFSGEVMPVKALNYWMDRVPSAKYINLYGPTEITCNCTYFEIKEKYPEDKMLPVGKAFPNTRVLLLNEANELITQRGAIGEVCIAGTCLGLGYWNNPQKTAEAFAQNPYITAYDSKIYRTGDLAMYDENDDLVFVSRKDFQIKHMGHRIELGEIETALNAIEFIDVACCIYSQKNEKIVCFYQSKNDNTKEVVKELGKKLPKYMWPNKYICMEKLPLNKNSKIDRVFLKKEYDL